MSGKKILGIIVLVAGILALAYGGFTYTQDTHEAKLGPLQLQYKEKKHINVPTWAGVAGIVVGGALLLWGDRK